MIQFGQKNNIGETVEFLCQKTKNTFMLINACRQGNVNEVETLLKEPLDLKIRNFRNCSLLHFTILRALTLYDKKETINFRPWEEILTLLLDKGVDPHQENRNGQTPLHCLETFVLLDDSMDRFFKFYDFFVVLIDSGALLTNSRDLIFPQHSYNPMVIELRKMIEGITPPKNF